MIYDCFTFFNENDLLEIRLNTLDEVVDKFVIVEAAKSFRGYDKPKYFDEKRFEQFKDKIIYVFVEDVPSFYDPWEYENWQRNYIMDVLKPLNCKDDDVIIISDLDEIPKAETIAKFERKYYEVYSLSMQYYSYYANVLNKKFTPWPKAKMMRYANLFEDRYIPPFYCVNLVEGLNKGPTPTGMRMRFHEKFLVGSGWHLSSLGGVDKVLTKLKNFAHYEIEQANVLDEELVKKYFSEKLDVWGKPFDYEIIDINEQGKLPPYLVENKEKFAHFFLKE